jgi:hypothetical protein
MQPGVLAGDKAAGKNKGQNPTVDTGLLEPNRDFDNHPTPCVTLKKL